MRFCRSARYAHEAGFPGLTSRKKIALTLQNKTEKIAPARTALLGEARGRNFLASFAGLGVPTGKGLSGILIGNRRLIPGGYILGGNTMMIGRFREHDGGYEGEVSAFGVEDTGLRILPKKEQQGSGPDFIVYGETPEGIGPDFDDIELYEVGAAWKKTSKAGKAYLSVKLDGPTLPAPINCALTKRQNGSWALVWNRKDAASPATDEAAAA